MPTYLKHVVGLLIALNNEFFYHSGVFSEHTEAQLDLPTPKLSATQHLLASYRDKVPACVKAKRHTPTYKVFVRHRYRWPAVGAEIDMNDEAFEIYAARSNLTIEVRPNETILSALNHVGIKVDTSCENGICGSCLTGVLQGKPEHRDLVLTDAEKAENNCIAVCCSRSHSRRLVLDI